MIDSFGIGLVLALVSGCAGRDADPRVATDADSDAGCDEGTAGDSSTPTHPGFDLVPVEWSVPSDISSVGHVLHPDPAYFGLLDLTGDGAPDLVDGLNDSAGEVFGGVGDPSWRLYVNTGAGFSGSAEVWTVPAAVSQSLHDLVPVEGTHGLLDLDGDGALDLVDPLDDASGEVWSDADGPLWKVYRNNGAGFDPSPDSWSLPEGVSTQLNRVSWSDAGLALVDMDCDGRLDLVDSLDDDARAVWSDAGGPYWNVHANTGRGFDDVPIAWHVPPISESLHAVEDERHGYGLRDMNGDTCPDLVSAEDEFADVPPSQVACYLSDGSPYWKVFPNTGVGFETTPISWWVPDFAPGSCAIGSTIGHFGLIDMDGDGLPELVDSNDDDASHPVYDEGTSYVPYLDAPGPAWHVHANECDAFAETAAVWGIPVASREPERIFNEDHHTTTMDIDGDGRQDIVDAMNDEIPELWSNGDSPYWRVYLGVP